MMKETSQRYNIEVSEDQAKLGRVVN